MTTNSDTDPTWLTTREAAERARVTPHRIRKAVANHQLRGHIPVGSSRWRFRPEDVDRWVRGERPPAVRPIRAARTA